MEQNIKTISESEVEIEVILTPEDYKEALTSEVKKLEKKIEVKGFRKGKVPRDMIKRLYGDSLEYEAAEEVVQKSFAELVDTQVVNPIPRSPKIVDLKFKPQENLQYTVRFEVEPKFELKDYKNIEIEVEELKVTDEILGSEFTKLLDSRSTRETTDTVDSENLIITADIAKILEDGSLDGNAGGKDMEIRLDSLSVNKEIVENSKGKKAGDTFEFTFEDRHTHSHDDGKEEEHVVNYQYRATIKKIEKIIPPEKDENLFMELSNEACKTEEELKSKIRNEIQSYYDQRMDDIFLNKLEEKILSQHEFAPPATFLENYMNRLTDEEVEERKKRKMPAVDKKQIFESLRPRATRALRWFYIREAIYKAEDLQITPEKIREVAENVAKTTGYPAEILEEFYSGERGSDEIKSRVFTDYLKSVNSRKLTSPVEKK